MNKLKRILKIIGLALSFILLLLCLPYLFSPIYNFPTSKIFSGDKLYNPYQDLSGLRIKANFHAHSKLGFGLTAGVDSPQKVVDTYHKMNFDLISLSNYHNINPKFDSQMIYMPNYEHGINIFKNHLLMVGAKEVDYFNFILYQSIHHKQYQINRLKEKSKFLIIPHPELRSAYTSNELANLSGYNAMEIHSRFAHSEYMWDSVLSAGRTIWGITNDDAHDMGRYLEVGRYWSYIYSSTKEEDDIISALKMGRYVAVHGHMGYEDNYLKNFSVTNSTINVELEKPAELISFIGHNGKVKQRNHSTASASYTFEPKDTYIRLVVKNDSTRFYFNPVFRYSSSPIQTPIVTVNYFYSVIYWIVSTLLFILIGFVIIKRLRILIKKS